MQNKEFSERTAFMVVLFLMPPFNLRVEDRLVLHGRTHLVLPTLAIQNCEFVATLPLPP